MPAYNRAILGHNGNNYVFKKNIDFATVCVCNVGLRSENGQASYSSLDSWHCFKDMTVSKSGYLI